ncbi:ovochymase-like isoform X2 [Culex pipiens pallens]|uniref:ovochymase-like isoform X2 n=1 Tax=Culex pipiens pallens TaxID=42434 RepID=UPI0022AA941B|nr:ovochymase-like isoform X2 [Culex pipiens pallens]
MCYFILRIPPDTVRLGDIDISLAELSQFGQQIKIKSFKKHPQHRFSKKYFDIALVELEREVHFNEAVCSACLWLEKHAPLEPMEAIGFGTTGYGEDLSPNLLKAKLSEISKDECLKRLPKNLRSLRDGLVEEQLCAASDHQDACEGDSGGPLQVERVDVNKMVIPLIVGVVSFGTPCTNGSTGVYTRVASYKEWIEHETGRSFDYSTCARSSECSSRKRIRSNIGSPPYYPINRVGLLWNASDSNFYGCGATLVDYKFALTSAFCVSSSQGFPKFVISESTEEIIPIVKVHIHPMYTLEKPENDLALLELTKYLRSDSYLLPACLWRNEDEKDTFEDMGFSVYSNFETISRGFILGTTVKHDGECSQQLLQERNLFCGNNPLKFIPTICKVDYGGPISTIVQHNVNMDLVFLHGVVSSLNKGCDKVLVGTRVAPHVAWIEEIVLGMDGDQFIFSP